MSEILDQLTPEEFRAAETLARRFHEAYERLAPAFSYSTRRASAVPWEQVPDSNRLLMIATSHEILRAGDWKSGDLRLSDLVRSEGYGLVIDSEPWRRPDVLGDPPAPHLFRALVCGRRGSEYIACVSDSWDHVYTVSHEIAHDRVSWEHTDPMLEMQATILTGWVKQLATRLEAA